MGLSQKCKLFIIKGIHIIFHITDYKVKWPKAIKYRLLKIMWAKVIFVCQAITDVGANNSEYIIENVDKGEHRFYILVW